MFLFCVRPAQTCTPHAPDAPHALDARMRRVCAMQGQLGPGVVSADSLLLNVSSFTSIMVPFAVGVAGSTR